MKSCLLQLVSFCLVRMPFLFFLLFFPSHFPSDGECVYHWSRSPGDLDGEIGSEYQHVSERTPRQQYLQFQESLQILGLANENIPMEDLTACAGAPHLRISLWIAPRKRGMKVASASTMRSINMVNLLRKTVKVSCRRFLILNVSPALICRFVYPSPGWRGEIGLMASFDF